MQEWTINNVSLADLGIDSLQLHLQNQDDDYVEIRFPRNYDAALPDGFDVDAQLVVRCGSNVVFRGEVATPLQSASAFAEYRSVFAYGPWHRFREMPFLYLYPYVTGAALSTHGVLGGNASDLLNAILTTNTDGIVQVGTIDVGSLAIPETEVYDQTLAQALQAVLRYIPGAVVAFDYSTAPPTVHIVADNSASLTSVPIDVNDGLNSAFNLSPLYARLISGVTLQYEATGQTKEGTHAMYQTGAGTDVDTIEDLVPFTGFFILGYDSAGNDASRRHFRRTLRLEGAFDVSKYTLMGQLWPYTPYLSYSGKPFNYRDLVHFQAESGSTLNNLKLMADRALFFRLTFGGTSSNFSFNFTGMSSATAAQAGTLTRQHISWISNSAGSGDGVESDWGTTMRPLMRIGPAWNTIPTPLVHISNNQRWWQGLLKPVFLQTESAAGIRALALAYKWDFVNTAGQTGDCENIHPASTEYSPVFLDTRTLGSVNASTGRFTHVKTVDNSSTVLPSAGIAAQLLAANSRLLYEGRLTRLLDDPSDFAGLNRKVLFTNLAVSALVQRLSYDTATNLADLTFGAPTHLGPQDLIALQRAGKSPA